MKIAILSMYSGLIDRGVETWTREMASRLYERGHEVVVFQGGEDENRRYKKIVVKQQIFWNVRDAENPILSLLVSPYWGLLVFFFTLNFLLYLIKLRPNIVLPTNGGFQTFTIRILTWILGSKMVLTGHAGIGASDKWNFLARPDYFVSPSRRGEKWAKSLVIAKGISVTYIPHGVDLKKFSPEVRKIEIDLERPIILCVSSFENFKRVDLAVRTIARLKKGSLLILGGEHNEDGLDNYAQKILGKRYLKIKAKPSEMPSYYVSSDVFTLPSDETEAFGIVYLEAMACGLPVVATDDELRREIIGEAGILIDPADTESYAAALKKALNTNWGDIPRKQAEKFNWDRIVSDYEKLFSTLLK